MKKNNGLVLGLSIGAGAVFVIACAVVLIMLFVNPKNMSKYQSVYSQLDERFQPYLMQDQDTEDLEKYKKNLKSAIEDKDTDQCDAIVTKLDNLEDTAKQHSEEKLEEMDTAIEQADLSALYTLEINDLKKYREEAQTQKDSGNYAESLKNYEQCQDIIDSAESATSYDMELSQVDVTEFPKVKLYLSVRNLTTGEAVENLEQSSFMLYEKLENSDDYEQMTVDKAVQLDENEGLNTAIVADVSASMGSGLYTAETAMENFVDSMQYNVNDRAALYSFADTVYREQYFTKKKKVLKKAIEGMTSGNMTALYDALVYSISDIVVEDGAKCVIAFTDGMENNSSSSKSYVIDKANQYDIPIYIIGIGAGVDSADLRDIADQTGGFYRNISDITSMGSVYQEIYETQKAMYVVQYKTTKKSSDKLLRDIYIRYSDDTYKIRTQSSYTPSEYKIDGYVFYDSDSRYLKKKELKKLSEEEVLIALNEIYARRGYKFTTNEFLIDHFSKCSWYNGQYDDQNEVAKKFNKYEKKNVKLLVNYEKKHKLNNRK
jgi:VWFA-related protein